MITPEMIEKVARELCCVAGCNPDEQFPGKYWDSPKFMWETFKPRATTALMAEHDRLIASKVLRDG